MVDTAATKAGADTLSFDMHGFVLRTPLLPVDAVLAFGSDVEACDWSTEAGYASGCEVVRGRMRMLSALPEVEEAIWLASPSLAGCLQGWKDAPHSPALRKVERSLACYLARMSTRPTPFGLFSGCSVGTFGHATTLSLEPRRHARRRSRLDMDYLFALTESLCRNQQSLATLRFRPNDTIVRVGDRLRYVEPRRNSTKIRSYHWVAVNATPLLIWVLQTCECGLTIDELSAAISNQEDDVTFDEAKEYVRELIDEQVLQSTLQPAVTGGDAIVDLIRQLTEIHQNDVVSHLEQARWALAQMDNQGLGLSPSAYEAVGAALAPIPIPVDLARTVQVDLVKPADLVLGPAVRAEIERCARMFVEFAVGPDPLANFRQVFEDRYGTASVPLLEALDPDSGVSLDAGPPGDEPPFVRGLGSPASAEDGKRWSPHHGWLLSRLQGVWSGNATELELSEDDLRNAFPRGGSSPSATAFFVACVIVARSTQAIDAGDFRLYFKGGGGPSGVRTLGRFADVDERIGLLVQRHIEAEEALTPEMTFAEVVHLPQGRVGNVLQRPRVRAQELTYLGRSGADEDHQMPVSELLVSVHGGEIVLRSRKSGARIIPRLTNAHNYHQPGTLPPYRFLASLQEQGVRSVHAWDWGPLSASPYLPRVRSGRLVLARARWLVSRQELTALSATTGRLRFIAAKEWAASRGVPLLTVWADADNELLVDFRNPLSVDAFVELSKTRPSVTLLEMLAGQGSDPVTSVDGSFAHELHVPIVRSTQSRGRSTTAAPGGQQVVSYPWSGDRDFLPGSEWVFAKIYASGAELDRILTDLIGPMVEEMKAAGSIDRWFFIRYQDSSHHLRLRLHATSESSGRGLIPALETALRPYVKAGLVSRVVFDTYQPELERYGGPLGLMCAELLFDADSEAAVALIDLPEYRADSGLRWQIALMSLDSMMTDFGLSPEHKQATVVRRRGDFAREFGGDTVYLRRTLARKFREHRRTIELLLSPPSTVASSTSMHEILAVRSRKLVPIVHTLRDAESARTISAELGHLVDSYMHMAVNRLVRSYGRAHELVLFDNLSMYYSSLEARGKVSRANVPHAGMR